MSTSPVKVVGSLFSKATRTVNSERTKSFALPGGSVSAFFSTQQLKPCTRRCVRTIILPQNNHGTRFHGPSTCSPALFLTDGLAGWGLHCQTANRLLDLWIAGVILGAAGRGEPPQTDPSLRGVHWPHVLANHRRCNVASLNSRFLSPPSPRERLLRLFP